MKHYEIKVTENSSYFVDGDGIESYLQDGIAIIYSGDSYSGTYNVVAMINTKGIIGIIETGDSKK